MILFTAKKSVVHDMHLDAIEDYARTHGLAVSRRMHGFGAVRDILTSPDPFVFSQSTGLASLIILPVARLRGKHIVHYLHEPTPLRMKVRENPLVKSIVWHAVQWIEVKCAGTIMVSRQALLDQAAQVYGVSPRKIALAPLLMPRTLPRADLPPKTRVTYMGRIDERRFFTEFLDAAPKLRQHGFRPTLLTGDTEALAKRSDMAGGDLDIIAEASFSEELKSRILSETLVLWNPKRGSIAQSGVTADAVRYGVSILLTDKDPSYRMLRDYGIALDFHATAEDDFQALTTLDPNHVTTAAASVFSETHGPGAFRKAYLPLLS